MEAEPPPTLGVLDRQSTVAILAFATMFGCELRKACEAAGLTQEKLSFEAGLDRTYISLLENDKHSPSLDVLSRVCDAMGVSASE